MTKGYVYNFYKDYDKTPFYAIKRKRKIDRYSNENSFTKLAVACGDKYLEGWLNSDLGLVDEKFIFINGCKSFPFIKNRIDFIKCEQFIEHLSFKQGFIKIMFKSSKRK